MLQAPTTAAAQHHQESTETMQYENQGLTYPDPTECPSGVAEAIFDIRRGANIIPSWRVLQRRYDTDHGVLVAVEVVYEQNEWIFERGWRSKWRKGFATKWV